MNTPGRNDPCPCGSGKKYKKCCLAHDAASQPAKPGAHHVNVTNAAPSSALLMKAVALHQAGNLDEAAAVYQSLLNINPCDSDALHYLGLIAHQTGRYSDAIRMIKTAIQINPNVPAFHCNLANAYKGAGQFDSAIDSYKEAVRLDPLFQAVYSNMGNTLRDMGRFEEAIASYRKALAIRPDFAESYSNMLFSMNYMETIKPLELLAEHKAFASQFEANLENKRLPHTNLRDAGKRLKIGYVSGDLYSHIVSFYIEPVLANHNKSQVEVFCYCNNRKNDAVTQRLMTLADHWVPCEKLSDDNLAARIRADGIDILVDLSGHTGDNRLLVFARKPAPVQVTWLGYFATTGLQSIDYILCDRYLAPPADADQFVEKPWYLPDTRLCFTPPQNNISIGALPAMANGYVTFGCFNNLSKINEAVMDLWAQILQQVKDSRLFLKSKQLDDLAVQQNISAHFAARNISPERLILEGSASHSEYLASYNRVDIALDPFPYTGYTVSLDGLWMGVPLITLAGDRLLARQGESLLHNMGLSDWIAADTSAYVAGAVARATGLDRLASLRAQLRCRLLASPLCDASGFTRDLESAYRGMWQAYCA